MKKTLIAMAAVAVAGVASAQVTITGAAAARFESSTSAAGTEAKGFTMSDASLKFSASEDLGGGLTATAAFGIDGMGADGAGAVSTGTTLAVSAAGVGTVAVTSGESSDYLPLDFAVTGSLFSNGTASDRVQFKSENIMGATITVTYSDGGNGQGYTVGNTSTTYELDYATGPFAANIGKLAVDKVNNTLTNGGMRYKVSYDAGVAKVTYGRVETNNATTDVKTVETGASVSVPLGAVTLGANSASSKVGSAAATSGTSFTASYALSKRTTFAFEKVSYDGNAGVNPQRTRLTLTHAF